jgi:hypothetical protein
MLRSPQAIHFFEVSRILGAADWGKIVFVFVYLF